jgi:hypothetical protein
MNSEQFPTNPISQSAEGASKPSKPIKKPIPKGSMVELPPPPPLIELCGNTPIPRASEPLQYRAIGLVKGIYSPSMEEFTRGTVLTEDQMVIDAVLLGRVMSLVKNHVELSKPHIWVVYPRMGKDDGKLHIQIMGLWEPELITESPTSDSTINDTPVEDNSDRSLMIPENYFSVRGEVVFQNREKKEIFVKIKQVPRKKDEVMKYFKLRLLGDFATKMVGHFWEFDAKREGDNLVIITGREVASLKPPMKKNTKKIDHSASPNKKPVKKIGNDSSSTSPSLGKVKPPAITRPVPPRLDLPKSE